jgi:hypothetical protein
MNSQWLRKVGTALFAVTVLAFVTLPFWISGVLSLLALTAETRVVRYLPFPALSLRVLLNLPPLIMASLWMGFLIAWFVSRRRETAHSTQGAARLTKTKARLLVFAGAVAFAVTAIVELEYLTVWGDAGLGSTLDESEYAMWHYYQFIEVPQIFLALLWTPFLVLAWLPRSNSPAANWRFFLTVGLLLIGVTGLVWMGYPDWTSGVAMISDTNKQIPAVAFSALDAVPALFVACIWLCFFLVLGSSLRTRNPHALGPA